MAAVSPDAAAAPADDPAQDKPGARKKRPERRPERRQEKRAERRAQKRADKRGAHPADTSAAKPRVRGARTRQLGLVLACTHPRVALLLAVGTGVTALLVGRTPVQSLAATGAVLLVQLVAGLMNDVCDRALDARANRQRKHVATQAVPAGNATFVATALFLVAVPMALQSGVRAGLILLATLLVAYLHNRVLHRTRLSFLGWVVTLPMLGAFVSYADRDTDVVAAAPTGSMIAVLALVGLCLHLITSLRDLPLDHTAGIRPLPLAIALRIGAPRLMYATIALTIAAAVALVIVARDPGLLR